MIVLLVNQGKFDEDEKKIYFDIFFNNNRGRLVIYWFYNNR